MGMGICCTDNHQQVEKQRGEVHLYNRDNQPPRDADEQTSAKAEELECRSVEDNHLIHDRMDLTLSRPQKKRRGSATGDLTNSCARQIPKPIELLSGERKIPLEAKLSSLDHGSIACDAFNDPTSSNAANDVSKRMETLPIAYMI